MAAIRIVVKTVIFVLLSKSFLQVDALLNVDEATSLIQQALTIPEGKCGIGMFHDNRINSCRSVYCPQYFYKNNGVCVPTHLTMDNVYFKAEFSIRTTTKLTIIQSVKLVKSYSSKANSLIANIFSYYKYEIHRYAPRGIFLECRLILYFVAEETKTTFLRNYALLELLMDEFRNVRVEMNGELIEFKTELAAGLLHTDYVGLNYNLIIVNGNFDTSNRRETRLSKSNFCYRVILFLDEIVSRTGDSMITLRNGITVWVTDVTRNGMVNEMVCIDTILSEQHFLFKWNPNLGDILFLTSPLSNSNGADEQTETNVDNQRTDDLNDRVAPITKEITITIIVVCIVLLIVVTRCVLSLIQRLQQTNEIHDDISG